MKNKEIKKMAEEMLKWDIEMETAIASNASFIKDLYCLRNIAHLFTGDNEKKKAEVASMLASAYFYDDDCLDAMDFIDCFAFDYSINKADIEMFIDWENYEEAAHEIACLCKLPFAPKDWCFETMYNVVKMSLTEKEDY